MDTYTDTETDYKRKEEKMGNRIEILTRQKRNNKATFNIVDIIDYIQQIRQRIINT